MRPLDPATSANRFRRSLLDWYATNQRQLPWRKTRDPYAIWLSEVMLQQTTVRTVEPRWRRFLERFPTLKDLARAPLDDVLHEWTGLGYYSRARNLHRAANVVAESFDGCLPADYELLLALPGMGVYTAAAVGSIAFGLPVPVLDANVERVVARLVALEDNARSPAARRLIRTHLDHHIDTKRPGDFNQAIMELGALVCTPKQPRCNDCPVRTHCRANALNAAERYPRLPEKAPIERVGEIAVVLRQGPEVLILKRPPSGSFADMWELPRGVFFEGEELEDASCRIVAELTGLRCTPRAPILRLRHTVMRQSIELHVIDTSACEGALQLSSHMDAEWTTPEEWHHLPKSTTQAQICDHLRGRLRKRRPETIAPPSEDSTPDLFGDNPQAD